MIMELELTGALINAQVCCLLSSAADFMEERIRGSQKGIRQVIKGENPISSGKLSIKKQSLHLIVPKNKR